jgi:Uma2 family endonuclease
MAVQLQRRLFTVDEYYTMLRAGILTEDDRVELLEGEIVKMAAIGSRHAGCVNDLNHALTVQLGPRAIIAVQNPIRLSERSEPQPDLAVLMPRSDSYRRSHPGPSDVLILIEVSDTTVEVDKDVKLPLYSLAGIREVWLVDLEVQRVEVYRDPSPNGYRSVRQATRGDSLSPLAFPDVLLSVNDILGDEEA